MKRSWMTVLLFLAGGVAMGVAAQPTAKAATLKAGDPAPKLQQGKYVQGEAVKEFAKGTAYIVEFWATWCGPCRASIPHLNETWLKYKDKGLVVIGQNCWERDEGEVAPFVKKMGEQMTYRVALDDKATDEQGAMAKTWMAAAGQNGIPAAFLVDTNGQIAWIGHPMDLQGKMIEAVLAGHFDAAKYQQQQELTRQSWEAVIRALRAKDWDAASAKLADLEKAMPEDQRDKLDPVRLAICFGKQDYPAAYKLVAKISEANKNEAQLQNGLAWEIATSPDIKERNLELAETLATRGNDAAKGKDPAILDTLARIKFMRGNKDEAIAVQEKATQLAEAGQREQYQRTLEQYKKGELPKVNGEP